MIKDIFFLTFGIFLQVLIFTDQINFYVHPQYRIIIFLAGIIITIVYIFKIKNRVLSKNFKINFKDKENYLYLSLLLIILLIAPSPLGTSLVSNKTFNNVNESESLISKDSPVINTENFEIKDWVNITSLSSNLKRYDNKPADVTGMLFTRNGETIIGKFQIACCAVDASVIGIKVNLENQEFTEGKWYELDGRTQIREDELFINANNITLTNEPENPYINN